MRLANLRAGDLDLTEGIAASDVKTVEADSKLALAKVTGLGYQGITFKVGLFGTSRFTFSGVATPAALSSAFALSTSRGGTGRLT